MYDKYYEFEIMPFENTADPRLFYASEQHREALAAIEYTIRMRKGIVLVTGPIGSGKTTVGRSMLQRCREHATIVQLVHGHRSGTELLAHALRALRVPMQPHDDHAVMLERLEHFLREQARAGRPIVLFVDEAQTISDEALEELRLLSNFDTETTKLLQLVLVGQPELRDRIASPRFSALRQRIVMAKQLRPMTIHETAGYIRHRIKQSSRQPDAPRVAFGGDAITVLHSFARGVPRLINVVCDNCLLLGYVKQTQRITPSMVQQVVADMVPSFSFEAATDQGPYSLAGSF